MLAKGWLQGQILAIFGHERLQPLSRAKLTFVLPSSVPPQTETTSLKQNPKVFIMLCSEKCNLFLLKYNTQAEQEGMGKRCGGPNAKGECLEQHHFFLICNYFTQARGYLTLSPRQDNYSEREFVTIYCSLWEINKAACEAQQKSKNPSRSLTERPA